MTESSPRRLRGHKATATCCIASRERPGLVATSGEDGCICWFDMRCKDVQLVMDVAKEPISSLCFKSDDGGEVKIIDIHQHCLYKTLRAGHSSICSSVQFLPWRPWEVITGGLDSRLVLWDFSKGRPYKILDFGLPDANSSGSSGQCFNPAFVHALAVSEVDMLDNLGKMCAVARGDGAVDVINIELELAAMRSKRSTKPRKGSQSRSKDGSPSGEVENPDQSRQKRLHLDYSFGGHTAAVSCVAFSLFGERGKFIISGGNDKSVKVWDWSRYLDAGQSNGNNNPHLNINLSKKVNWLCTTPTETENLVVCDTTKVVKVYSVS